VLQQQLGAPLETLYDEIDLDAYPLRRRHARAGLRERGVEVADREDPRIIGCGR